MSFALPSVENLERRHKKRKMGGKPFFFELFWQLFWSNQEYILE
jgi:hypothetical protein